MAATTGLIGHMSSAIIMLSLFLNTFYGATPEAHAADHVSGGQDMICVQLNSAHHSRFAGLYTAVAEGYYGNEGLVVSFVEGAANPASPSMGEGQCPVGVTTAMEIVLARKSGFNVKAIAAIEQVSPIGVFTAGDSGITRPRQLRHKTIAMDTEGSIPVYAMLLNAGIRPTDVKAAHLRNDIASLISGEVDAIAAPAYAIQEEDQTEGRALNVIYPFDYGAQFYGNVIYATADALAQRPDMLKRFLRATFKGWMRAIQDPRTGVEHTLKYADHHDPVQELASLKSLSPYIHTGQTPIGMMNIQAWNNLPQLMMMTGQLTVEMKAETLYTTSLVEAIHEDYDK